MLASRDWKELDGEYIDAMPGGSICGGALQKEGEGKRERGKYKEQILLRIRDCLSYRWN